MQIEHISFSADDPVCCINTPLGFDAATVRSFFGLLCRVPHLVLASLGQLRSGLNNSVALIRTKLDS